MSRPPRFDARYHDAHAARRELRIADSGAVVSGPAHPRWVCSCSGEHDGGIRARPYWQLRCPECGDPRPSVLRDLGRKIAEASSSFPGGLAAGLGSTRAA